MSAKAAENLKRTCLICGCHTNQTINIFEPRSGPNIVNLIQAKFKFQPLNDDKFLCFSCNNWLINWHSLQVLNSNDTESPSGNFRSHAMQDNADNGKPNDELELSKAVRTKCCRPIARVSPRLSENGAVKIKSTAEVETSMSKGVDEENQPIYIISRHLSRNTKIVQTLCEICQRKIVFVSPKKSFKLVKSCRKCRNIINLQNKSIQNLLPNTNNLVHKEYPIIELFEEGDTNKEKQEINSLNNNNYNTQTWQKLPRPRLDGKVVSKLRRLGTTVAREMSDVSCEKNRNRFCERRKMDDDEILLDFNTTISEVLPIEKPQKKGDECNSSHELIVSSVNKYSEHAEGKNNFKSLTISLVEGSYKNLKYTNSQY